MLIGIRAGLRRWCCRTTSIGLLLGISLVSGITAFSQSGGIADASFVTFTDQPRPQSPASTAGVWTSTRFLVGNALLLAADGVTMLALNDLWYADYERSRFHWHNDWDNWKQQDKLGHLMTAWGLSRAAGSFALWSGMSRRPAAWYGAGMSVVFLTQIEVLDGFSEGWGASFPDFLFNFAGAVAGGVQIAHPETEWIAMKYSYRRSQYYDDTISWAGNAIKDYEGATYWLVVRPGRILDQTLPGWPRWLALSFGHGASGLSHALPTPDAPHRREIFVGVDLDVLSAIDWPKPWMHAVASALSFIRIPAPALQVHPDLRFHALLR